jgi:hypothetical protein
LFTILQCVYPPSNINNRHLWVWCWSLLLGLFPREENRDWRFVFYEASCVAERVDTSLTLVFSFFSLCVILLEDRPPLI